MEDRTSTTKASGNTGLFTPPHVLKARNAFRADWRFFLENAGYATPPGRAKCALDLAHAERQARNQGYTFEWEYDCDGCSGCDCGNKACKCASGEEHETLACVCRTAFGKVAASLCGICEPSKEYRRVVEAELALEALNS